jgi:surfactin synthase thioesterase subunit
MNGRWVTHWPGFEAGKQTLVCIPEAGAGCGQFSTWQSLSSGRMSVAGVQLPGRETRWGEAPAATMRQAVDEIVSDLIALMPAPAHLVIFGQSFGALLAYEVAVSAGSYYGSSLVAVVVAACEPPHVWEKAGEQLLLSEDELNKLIDARGLSEADLDEDSRNLMLSILRQDTRLAATYAGPGESRLGCHLEAWAGRDDDIVPPAHMDGWSTYTDGPFSRRVFQGGHYFPRDQASVVLPRLQALADTPAVSREAQDRTAPC